MNEKQQQLTFEKGITNVPSDVLCSDNTLEESLGMVYDNGEHRVIQWPKEFMTEVRGKLLFVHHIPGGETKYLVLEEKKDEDEQELNWGFMNEQTRQFDQTEDSHIITIDVHDKILQVTAVGHTIIINTTAGLVYALWDVSENKYRIIGQNIPEPKIEFMLAYGSYDQEGDFYPNYETAQQETGIDLTNADELKDPAKQEEWNNFCFGLYAVCESNIKEKNAFSRPFFLRYALRLYDGNYMYISNPILALPSTDTNCQWETVFGQQAYRCKVGYCKLYYKLNQDYSDFSDIVEGVDVFASYPVEIIDKYRDAVGQYVINSGWRGYGAELENIPQEHIPMVYHEVINYGFLTHRSQGEIRDDLIQTSVFYKICELGRSYDGGASLSELPIKSGTITNLTTQIQLPYDDYFSHSPRTGDLIKVYNNRLHMTGVKRGFYDGYSSFVLASDTNDPTFTTQWDWCIQVFIKASNGKRVVKKEFMSNEKLNMYFYYPDPRAYKANVYDIHHEDSPQLMYSLELAEHPGLNGAYFLGTAEKIDMRKDLDETDYTFEPLDNILLQTEVNNPFLFKADGEITIGLGKVYNIATQTTALSQGQFGQYPLIAFCSDGIWALEMDKTGVYISAQPFSREVCIEGGPVIETDGAVFFASNKGLMIIVGSQVKCVSEQLSGKAGGTGILGTSFQEYLKDAFIAYDYRDSLLWIFNMASGFEEQCYVYSIKSGTFGTVEFFNPMSNAVPDYPDYLLQNDGILYTLLYRDNINDDKDDEYSATLKTRPMKLEDGLALKTIMQMKHIACMCPNAVLKLKIFASNNLDPDPDTWVELHSLRGTPWKYYKFQYDFSDMVATDRFAGTVLITQERRTNKLR